MRAASVGRFVLFGAVGVGITGAISASNMVSPALAPFSFLFGGAALGLAFRDWRKVAILAPLGALGLTLGIATGLSFTYSEVPIATVAGAVAGASMGVAFGDWRWVVTLGVVGGLGFGVGLFAGTALPTSLPERMNYAIAVGGVLGGASLGAALGYLESRKLAEERRPRVR